MEITSYPLSLKQLKKILPFIFSFFEQLNQVYLMYGWECDVENQYEYFLVPTKDLEGFISISMDEKKFKLGISDLYIKDKNDEFELLLCHESDIHLKSSNKSILEKMKVELREMKIDFTVAEKGKL